MDASMDLPGLYQRQLCKVFCRDPISHVEKSGDFCGGHNDYSKKGTRGDIFVRCTTESCCAKKPVVLEPPGCIFTARQFEIHANRGQAKSYPTSIRVLQDDGSSVTLKKWLDDEAEKIVGPNGVPINSIIDVFWPLEMESFRGKVTGYVADNLFVVVEYEDGDVEHLNLAQEFYTRVSVPPRGNDARFKAFAEAANQYRNLSAQSGISDPASYEIELLHQGLEQMQMGDAHPRQQRQQQLQQQVEQQEVEQQMEEEDDGEQEQQQQQQQVEHQEVEQHQPQLMGPPQPIEHLTPRQTRPPSDGVAGPSSRPETVSSQKKRKLFQAREDLGRIQDAFNILDEYEKDIEDHEAAAAVLEAQIAELQRQLQQERISAAARNVLAKRAYTAAEDATAEIARIRRENELALAAAATATTAAEEKIAELQREQQEVSAAAAADIENARVLVAAANEDRAREEAAAEGAKRQRDEFERELNAAQRRLDNVQAALHAIPADQSQNDTVEQSRHTE